jgi:site-specific DNA recombinase
MVLLHTRIYVCTGVHSRSTGQSLAVQEQACRSYASTLDWDVGEVFTDRGIAVTRWDRPDMGRLLAAVRDGAIECVLIARPDRLSRSHADTKAIVHEMEARGVEYLSDQQPVYTPGPATTSVEE